MSLKALNLTTSRLKLPPLPNTETSTKRSIEQHQYQRHDMMNQNHSKSEHILRVDNLRIETDENLGMSDVIEKYNGFAQHSNPNHNHHHSNHQNQHQHGNNNPVLYQRQSHDSLMSFNTNITTSNNKTVTKITPTDGLTNILISPINKFKYIQVFNNNNNNNNNSNNNTNTSNNNSTTIIKPEIPDHIDLIHMKDEDYEKTLLASTLLKNRYYPRKYLLSMDMNHHHHHQQQQQQINQNQYQLQQQQQQQQQQSFNPYSQSWYQYNIGSVAPAGVSLPTDINEASLNNGDNVNNIQKITKDKELEYKLFIDEKMDYFKVNPCSVYAKMLDNIEEFNDNYRKERELANKKHHESTRFLKKFKKISDMSIPTITKTKKTGASTQKEPKENDNNNIMAMSTRSKKNNLSVDNHNRMVGNDTKFPKILKTPKQE